MGIQGYMINGKFTDTLGRVYKITPAEAEILNETDGTNGTNTIPSNGNGKNAGKGNQSTTPPIPPATPQTPPQSAHPAGATTAPPAPTPTTQPAQPTYPKCISYEILKAIQTPDMAQVSVRAHCKGQFADAVVHHDFKVAEQAYELNVPSTVDNSRDATGTTPPANPQAEFLKFKQTALKAAYAEAVEIARKLLCEQK